MRTLRHLSLALLAALPTACVAPAPARPDTVQHVVLCWLHEPGDAEQRQRVIDASAELRRIPEVLRLHVGTALASEREIVDDSFDVGLVIEFATPEDLAAYEVHPDHVERVQAVFAPLAERIVVYDVHGRR